MNNVYLQGYVTDKLGVKTLKTTEVATFTLTVDQPWQKDQTKATLCNVTCYGNLVGVYNELEKGMKVFVIGRVQTRSGKSKDGNSYSFTEVIASSIAFMEVHTLEKSNEDETDIPF